MVHCKIVSYSDMGVIYYFLMHELFSNKLLTNSLPRSASNNALLKFDSVH
jgi:hypothetical protein